MPHISEQQLKNRVNQLAQDHDYIDELTADMFDAEGHNRVIEPPDVSRLRDIIFNRGYLKDIAKDQLKDELSTAPAPHGYLRN